MKEDVCPVGGGPGSIGLPNHSNCRWCAGPAIGPPLGQNLTDDVVVCFVKEMLVFYCHRWTHVEDQQSNTKQTATYILPPTSAVKSYIISVKKMNPDRSMCRTHATWASVSEHMGLGAAHTLCYAILLPGRQSGVRAGLRPDSNRENFKIGRPKAGRRVDSETFPPRIRPKCDPETPFPARMHYCVAEGITLKLRTRPNGN